MTRAELMRRAQEQVGRTIPFTQLLYALRKGHVSPPVQGDDRWFDYSEQNVEEFVRYVKSRAHRRHVYERSAAKC